MTGKESCPAGCAGKPKHAAFASSTFLRRQKQVFAGYLEEAILAGVAERVARNSNGTHWGRFLGDRKCGLPLAEPELKRTLLIS